MVDVRDPRTGRVERPLAPASPDQLRSVVADLRAHQGAWQALGVAGRSAALTALADAIDAHRDALVDALVRDTGRLVESRIEVDSVIGTCRRWAATAADALAPVARGSASLPGIELETQSRPYPVVGVISPWNFPLLLALIDAVPALAAGCAVVVKPSEVTPRFAAPLMDAVRTVPALRGVLTLVEGDGPVGAALVGLVDAVCFTGSVATGRAVAVAAAQAFVPAFLELGGKDPAVVLAGADLERASSALLWGGTSNAGQSCLSIERVYVEAGIAEEFVDLLVAKAESLQLAWPEPDSGQLGPMIDPAQADVVARHLADAVARGAVVRCGGVVEEHGGGRWIRPTVVTGVSAEMTLMREETFGPVLPVATFVDEDEAVRLANDTSFGLSAAVFGPDLDTARRVARRIDAGAVSVNDAGLTAFVHDGEKNSFGDSGLGQSRMGASAVRRFVRSQTLIVNPSTAPDPWWPR